MINILALDDDPVTLTLIQSVMEQKGFIVQTFTEGQAALEHLKFNDYDLILSDLMMPGMDGEVFYKEVRLLKPGIPFIFLTANDSIDTAVQVMKTGADDYLQKPFKGPELLLRAEKAVREKKRELFIRKTLIDDLADRQEREGLFSWKQLYGMKESGQAKRILDFVILNMEEFGEGFSWLEGLSADAADGTAEEKAAEYAANTEKMLSELKYIRELSGLDLNTETTRLSGFLDEFSGFYYQEMIPLVSNHHKRIGLSLPDEIGDFNLETDRAELFRIFHELLCNAVKYSPRQSKILLFVNINTGAGNNEKILEISFLNEPEESLSESGGGEPLPGIPYESSETVFELFSTLSGTTVRMEDENWSQGSGLYIARKLLHKMGGMIDARNIVMYLAQKALPYVKVTVFLPLK